MHLITAVQHVCPDEALVFVVDRPTAEGYDDAEAQSSKRVKRAEHSLSGRPSAIEADN
jgi:hypothetical protein